MRYADFGSFAVFETAGIRVRALCKPKSDRLLGGGFVPFASIPSGSFPVDIVSGDWNRDGRIDLTVSLWLGEGVAILQGAGDGTFSRVQTLPTGGPAAGLAVLDQDLDGRTDLAVTLPYQASVAVLRNLSGE